jgi:chromosome segregation ATPase
VTALEEEKKSLSYRVQQLLADVDERNRTIQEKERMLAYASSEFQAAAEELKQAREQFQRFKSEVAGLRDNLRGAEKENLATLQSIVTCLEQVLQHDKPAEAPKEPVPSIEPGPSIPSLPKGN